MQIDLSIINEWQTRQKTRIPNYQSLKEEAKLVKVPTINRVFSALGSLLGIGFILSIIVVMIIGAPMLALPVGGLIFRDLFHIDLRLATGIAGMGITIVIIGFLRGLWKTFDPVGAMRNALDPPLKIRFYNLGKRFENEKEIEKAASCYAMFLAERFKNNFDTEKPNYIIRFYTKNISSYQNNPVFQVLSDLLFVEVFLEASLFDYQYDWQRENRLKKYQNL